MNAAPLEIGSLAGWAAATPLDEAMRQGLLPFLWLCFGGGLLALLTPCVFPMVPVTVSYFSKRTEKGAHLAAIAYCAGIIAAFAVVGVLAALLFGATGLLAFAANPWVNLALAAMFVAMALNLFGLYEIRLPSGIVNRLSARSRQGGLVGPILMGTTFALTTFTCTAPIVGALLAASAKGSVWYPALGMASFGLAFSLPFLALAMFPSMVKRMPRSGSWLEAVKPALGFIELMAAVKFLSNADLVWQLGLLTRPVFLLIWAALAVMLAAYLFGLPRGFSRTGVARRGLALASLVLAFFFLSGMTGRSLGEINAFLPPEPYPAKGQKTVQKKKGEFTWTTQYDAALARARQENRPVFVDFTGVTCTNCRWMEQNVFVLPEVKERLAEMVPVQLYTDRGTPEDRRNQELQKKLANTVALPVYVLLSPEGKVIKTFEGASRNPKEFVDFLDQART